MNPYIEKLKHYLEDCPGWRSYEDGQSVIELLCYIYTEENSIDNSVIRYQFRDMDRVLNKLTFEENERISSLTTDLCTEHARCAFLDGIHVGFQLFSELTGSSA